MTPPAKPSDTTYPLILSTSTYTAAAQQEETDSMAQPQLVKHMREKWTKTKHLQTTKLLTVTMDMIHPHLKE